jgi:peptidoglycan/xylan/chitin deacetylase (PgdA/CDA1 family)
VDRIVAEGHTVFWHSRRHRNQWKTDPLRGFLDVWSTPMILRRGSASVHAFRPPYGKLTLGTVLACLARRWPVISWTHPSGDTCKELPEIGSFVDKIDRDQGGVILMHDMDRSEPQRARFVLETTSRLIDLAEQRNWELISSPNDWKRIT